MLSDYISVITPLLLHMLLSEAVVLFMGNRVDVTTRTMIAALVVIPVAAWMYRRDQKKWKNEGKPGKQLTEHTVQYIGRKECVGRKIGFGIFCFGAGAVLNVVWSGILNMLRISEYFSNQTQEELLAAQVLVQVIGLGILVPVAEELIFRGLIYQRMKHLMPLWAAALLSCLLFAVYHGNMIQIIFAFPMALALILVYEKGKAFAFPVLFHMGANLAAVMLNIF